MQFTSGIRSQRKLKLAALQYCIQLAFYKPRDFSDQPELLLPEQTMLEKLNECCRSFMSCAVFPSRFRRAAVFLIKRVECLKFITTKAMARQRRGLEMGILMLIWQFAETGINNIPPVTIAVIAGQVNMFT